MSCVFQSWESCFQVLSPFPTSNILGRRHHYRKVGQEYCFWFSERTLYQRAFSKCRHMAGQGCPLHGYSVLCYVSDRLGVDNRVERTRDRVNYDGTYTKLFNRVNQEIVKGQTKHLIIMLGISFPMATNRNRCSHRISATRLA